MLQGLANDLLDQLGILDVIARKKLLEASKAFREDPSELIDALKIELEGEGVDLSPYVLLPTAPLPSASPSPSPRPPTSSSLSSPLPRKPPLKTSSSSQEKDENSPSQDYHMELPNDPIGKRHAFLSIRAF